MKDIPIVVLVVEPGKAPALKVLDGSLTSMQEVVGGDIEQYMLFEDEVAIVCNGEGKFNGMPFNRGVYGENGELLDIICGTFFICYAPIESEHYLSLSDELIHKYATLFGSPERFFRHPKDDKLFAIPWRVEQEYLGVKWQYHEHEDAVDIQFMVDADNGIDYEDLDFHVVPKYSDEYYNIEAVAKELAGNMAIKGATSLLNILEDKDSNKLNLSEAAWDLYNVFLKEYLDNEDSFGWIPVNAHKISCFGNDVINELLNAGIIQVSDYSGVAYELSAEWREEFIFSKERFKEACDYFKNDIDIDENLDLLVSQADKLIYCFEHKQDMMDFDFWCQFENLLGDELSFDEFLAVNSEFDGDPYDVEDTDVRTIARFKESLDRYRQGKSVEELVTEAQDKANEMNSDFKAVEDKEPIK